VKDSQAPAIRPARYFGLRATLLFVAASPLLSTIARAHSARAYLNAPIGSWLTTYNGSYLRPLRPRHASARCASAESAEESSNVNIA